MLWLLPKAAPVLLRHLAAYAQLAALDLGRAKRRLVAQLVAVVTMLVGVMLAALFGCIAIIAYAWDTPYRVGSIAAIAGTFLLIGIIAAIFLSRLGQRQPALFATLRQEWREDQAIWESILSDKQE